MEETPLELLQKRKAALDSMIADLTPTVQAMSSPANRLRIVNGVFALARMADNPIVQGLLKNAEARINDPQSVLTGLQTLSADYATAIASVQPPGPPS